MRCFRVFLAMASFAACILSPAHAETDETVSGTDYAIVVGGSADNGKNITPSSEMAASASSESKYVAITDARWGNIGDAQTSGVATKLDGGGYTSFTMNFSKTDNLSHMQIGGAGTVKISKIRLFRRQNKSDSAPQVTITQGSKTIVSSSQTTVTDQKIYGPNWPTTANNYWTMTAFDAVFTSDVEIDTSADFTISFSSTQLAMIQPAASGAYSSATSAYSPAIEITGDYTFVGSKPKYLMNFYHKDTSGADGWANYTQTTGSTIPQSGGTGTVTTNGISFATDDLGGNFRYDMVGVCEGNFSSGTYEDVYGNQHASLLEEITSSLGANVDVSTPLKTGIANGAKSGNTATISGLTAGTKYVAYFAFGTYGTGDDTPGFKMPTDGYGSLKSLEYVVNGAGESGDIATVVTTTYTSFAAGKTIRPASKKMLVVRAVLTPTSSGTIKFVMAGKRSVVSFVAIAEMPASNNSYEATVTGNTNFSDIEWTPAKPDGGFASDAELIINNTAAAEVTMDETVAVDSITANNGADLALTIKNAASLTVNTLTAGDDSSLIVSGVPGSVANLTVAGAVTFEDTLTFASGKTLTVNGTLTGGFTFVSGSTLSFGANGALVIPSGKVVDWQAGINNATHRQLLAKTTGDGWLKMAVTSTQELQIHSDTTAHTANVNVEYVGTCEIHFVGTDEAGVDEYTVSAGKTVKFENGTIWAKRSVFYVNGTLIAKYFKLGHEANGAYTGKITVNNGGYVKTQKVTFTNKGGNSGLDIKTGGTFEFLQNDESAIALAASDKTYSVNLNGGTLRAVDSSWHVGSDIAMTIGAASTISAAADKTITIAGAISGSGNVSVTGAGSVILNGANTDTGAYTVADGTSLTLGTSRTMTIVGASEGTITVTLSAAEKTSLDGGNEIKLIGVSGDTFSGTLKAIDLSGAAYEINEPTISAGKLVITKKEGARLSPFRVTNPTNETWTIAGWADATTPTALDVRPEDWDNKVSANVTVESEQNKVLTTDRVLTIGTLTITNAGTLAVSASSANTLTADSIVINNSGTVTLTNNIVVSGTVDDSDSTGATTIAFAPGASPITAGANTILNTAGTGIYTIGSDKKLTVKSGLLASTQVSNSGTLNFEGGTAESPINLSGTGNFGTVTLGANTYVVNTENAANHKHVVTGQGATSYYAMLRTGGASPGMLDGTMFSNLILVSKCNSSNKVWLEHTTMTDGTVGLKLDGPMILNGSDVTIRSLAGSADLTRAGSQTLTICCKEDAEFSGACKAPVVIGEGEGLQTFSGSMTSTLTVKENATVKLTGSASPTSIAVEGTVYFSCATDMTYANAITGAGNIIVNNDGETGAMAFTGDLSGFTGKIIYKGGSYNIGAMRTYSVPSYIVLESGVTLAAVQAAAEYAQGVASTFTGFTAGQTITLKKLVGTSEVLTVDEEGKASSTAEGVVHIDGPATYADATFTNATSSLISGGWMGTLSYKSRDDLGLQYDTAVTTNAAGTGAYLKHHPWITGLPKSFMQSEEMTIAVVGEMSPSNNTMFVHFGTTTSSNKGIFLATGSKENEVVVKMNTGTELTDITTMTVPHAATSRHVYIITKKDVGNESTVSVYLDGTPWKTVKFSKISLTGGVQCGSDHGGQLRNNHIVEAVTGDDTALINVLRVYDRVISEAEINVYSDVYPYVSASGTSSRTFTGEAEDWIGADDAKFWSFKQTATSEAMLTNAPVGTSSVEIKGTADVTTTIAVNLDSDEHSDSVTISSPGAFKFAKAESKTGLIVSGQTTIGCPVEIEYQSLDISGAPLTLIDEGAIEFDLKNVDLSTYFEDATILLTGGVEQDDTKITCKNLTQMAGRTATFGYKDSGYAVSVRMKGTLTATVGEGTTKFSELVWKMGGDVVTPNWKYAKSAVIETTGNVILDLDDAATNATSVTFTTGDISVFKSTEGDITATFTASQGNTVCVYVAEGTTITALPCIINGTVGKTGAGTMAEVDIDRTYLVKEGTMVAGTAKDKTGTVTIDDGATFDFNGAKDGYTTINLNGGSLVNNGTDMGTGSRQIEGIALTANSTIGGTGMFGMSSSGHHANTLDLGGNTLTKAGINTFFLINTTVTNGTIKVTGGTLKIYELATSFIEAGLTLGASTMLQVDSELNIGEITSDGGTIRNAGTISAFKLYGTVTVENSGKYGTITLSDRANINLGNKRGLSLGGTGTVSVRLTKEEAEGSDSVVLFVNEKGADIDLGTVLDASGNDITDRCRLEGGTLILGQVAKIRDTQTRYMTLALAIEAVENGQTIELLSYADFSGNVTKSFAIDLCGHDVSFGAVRVLGSLEVRDSTAASGTLLVGGLLSVAGGEFIPKVPVSADGGSISVDSGSLANTDKTIWDGAINISIGRSGQLDLSAGSEVRCRDFTSHGAIVGTTAALAVSGSLDASAPVRLSRVVLKESSTLIGTGLAATNALDLASNRLNLRVSTVQEGMRIAEVPAGMDIGKIKLVVNGGVEGEYSPYRNPGETALRIKKSESTIVDIQLSIEPDTNKVNRVDFESAVVSGEVHWHGGGGAFSGVTNAYVVALASDGSAITQKVDYVSGDGTFTHNFGGLDAGETYVFSAYVDVGGAEASVGTVVRDVDFASARSIVRKEDGTGGWIYEDAETFDGCKPGTGYWYGTNKVAYASDGIICLCAEDWTRSAEFQPTNMTLEIDYSSVKDLHFYAAFDCPGFYTYEPYPIVQDGVSAAFTLVADLDDNCCFAVVSNGVWSVVPRAVFAPSFETPYDVLVRLDGVNRSIQYSVISDSGVVRLATCDVVDSKDISLNLSGAGSVVLIEGIAQDSNLARVGDEEFETVGEAIDAAGGVGTIEPLWWTRYVVSDDGGTFRIWDPNGYLQLIWQKWHHWGLEDGVYRFISGNNWIEYADKSGVVERNDGSWFVTNEVGLAWIAEQSTNQWFDGRVELGAPLDLSSKNWTPIAQFSGTFDGRGHTIAGLNNVHVIHTNLLGSAGYYFGGPTNDWGYVAYGLFGSATNAAFADVTFEEVAISNVADSVATLLGVHAGGDLSVSNVTVGSGCVEGEGRAVAGILTVGGETNGDIVVMCNTNRATVVALIANDADGGNVAQVLAGASWDTVFEGNVIATNNVGEGVFDVHVTDGVDTTDWYASDFSWYDLPVCNFAAAVMRFTDEGGYRRFVEANDPASVPIDPYKRTARMLADSFANGADNVAGEWTDRITAMPEGGHVDIDGTGNIIDTWEPVRIDRNLSFNLNSNFVYTVYDNDTFTIAEGVRATVSNGVVYVGEGCEAFGGDVTDLTTNNVKVVKLDEDFYERTVMIVDGMLLSVSEAIDYLHAGSYVELFTDTGLTIDSAANAVLLDGNKIAELSEYQSLTNAVGGDGTVAYLVRLNEKAIPSYDFELTGVDAGSGTVQINVVGARAGLYYAVQHKTSLVENWSEPSKADWVKVMSDGSIIQFTLPASESSGFYRIKVTDYLPAGD